MIEQSQTIMGKKLVPALLVGFFLFTILGLLATYGIAHLMAPHLPKVSQPTRP